MHNFVKAVKTFLVSEEGPAAVEYAVMLALILVVCLAAIRQVGHEANHTFEDASDALT